MAHAWNSLCNIIVHTTSNPIILLYPLLPNPTSILHLTPLHSSPPNHSIFLCPIFPHHFAPIPLFPSISYLSLPLPSISFPTPHHSIHLLPVPPPLAEPSSIWPPPHHPVFELCPIPSTSSFLFCHHYFNPNQLLLQLYPTSDYFPYMNSTYLVPHDSPSLGYCTPLPTIILICLKESPIPYIFHTQCTYNVHVCRSVQYVHCTGTSPHYMYMYNVHNSIQNVNI